MERNWARLGEMLKAARKRQGVEQQQIARDIGVGRGAIANIEMGEIKKITPTVRSYARLVGWTADSPGKVLAGGDPELVEAKEPTPAIDVREALTNPEAAKKAGLDDLGLAVIQALGEGRLVGTHVWTTPVAGTKMRMTMVARLEPDAGPEDERVATAEWLERGEAMRRVAEGDEPSDTGR